MKNTSWVWKEIRREKSAKIVFLAISFSFLVTVLMFIVSGTFIKNVQKQTEDIYGYFDHILYHAEQNTDNLSFSQKKISKKYQPYVKRIGTITLFDYEENQKNFNRFICLYAYFLYSFCTQRKNRLCRRTPRL